MSDYNTITYERESANKALDLLNDSNKDFQGVNYNIQKALGLLDNVNSPEKIRKLEQAIGNMNPNEYIQKCSEELDDVLYRMKDSIDTIESYAYDQPQQEPVIMGKSIDTTSLEPNNPNATQVGPNGEQPPSPPQEPTPPEQPTGPNDPNAQQVGPNGEQPPSPPQEPTPPEQPTGPNDPNAQQVGPNGEQPPSPPQEPTPPQIPNAPANKTKTLAIVGGAIGAAAVVGGATTVISNKKKKEQKDDEFAEKKEIYENYFNSLNQKTNS